MQTIRSFLLKNVQSIENLVEIFNIFSLFSGLKPNLKKCEIAGIGSLKGVEVAVCGMWCINICNKAIKILGTYFLYQFLEENGRLISDIIEISGCFNITGFLVTMDI